MNREIKFRAWTGERMIDDQGIYHFERSYIEREGMSFRCFEDWRDLEDGRAVMCHLMQFTGLKDKNGVEIYEGDILRVTGPWDAEDGSNTINIEVMFHAAGGYVIEWSNGFLGGEADLSLIGWAMDEDYSFEVIGNIYETPDLLK